MIVPLLQLGGSLVKGWMGNRQKKAEQKHELAAAKQQLVVAQVKAKIKRVEDDNDKASDLDMYFVQKHGTTQAISFYIMLSPAVLAFIGYEEQVMKGFNALAQMPTWYQYALGGMLIAVWGYRRVLNAFIQKKMTSLISPPNSEGVKK